MFAFNINLTPPGDASLDAAMLAQIRSNIEGALRQIGQFVQGFGTIDVGVSFTHVGSNGYLADSDTEMFVALSATQLQPGTVFELLTGTDPNQGVQDLHIIINQDQLPLFWLDPTPDDRSETLPQGTIDFEGVMMHELLHGFGFTGNSRALDGSFANDGRAPMDQATRFDPALGWVYDTPAMRAANNGNPVVVDSTHGLGSRWYHVATDGDLMFWAASRNVRPTLSDVDLALLHDNGIVSAAPDAANNVWFGSDGSDLVDGLAGNDHLYAMAGDDRIVGGAGDDLIDGGDGVDVVVYARGRAQYGVSGTASERVVQGDGLDQLRHVEVLQFADKTLFSLSGSDATVARLYGAAFARAPDVGGLQVQLGALHVGITPLQLAANFVASAEFVARYGVNSTDAQFVNALYGNVLGRAPDPGGLAVQLDALAHGLSRAQLLLNFGESAENRANVASDWLLT